jgi:nucleotide-binding universal stress UspA family protein
MTVFQKILVAYDGSAYSKRALEKAARFMDADSSVRTHIVNVTPHPVERYGTYLMGEGMSLLQKIEEDTKKDILEAEELMADYKHACQFVHLQGEAAKELVLYSNDHKIDLIIMGNRGMGTLGMLLGSVSERVIQHADSNVMIIK